MDLLNKNKIKEILVELVRQPSISNTEQEVVMADKLHSILKRINYFKNNPGNIFIKRLENDNLSRKIVAALLRKDVSYSNTVILLNHLDVVDVDGFGENRDLAFKPLQYTTKIKNGDFSLPERVKQDINKGDFLFGRGVSDMKGGQALQIALLQYYSKHLNELEGNILFLSVPDEETSSRGAINSISLLKDLKEKLNLNYKAIINSEPVFPNYPGDNKKYIYTGSAGKAVTFYYCVGKETHATDMFSGLNSNLLASRVMYLLEANVDFCENLEGLKTAPPSCLKLTDCKKSYSATIPYKSVCYFNLPVLTSTPQVLLSKMIKLGEQAFEDVLKKIKDQKKSFFQLEEQDSELIEVEWGKNVYSYQQFYNRVYQKWGKRLDKEIGKVFEKNKNILQQQDLALKIVDKVHEMSGDVNPKIITGFLPPFYPSVYNARKDKEEIKIYKTVENIIALAEKKYNVKLELCNSFLGISDLSFYKLLNYEDILNYLKPNMPDWGLDYELPLSEINELDIPVLNLGVFGRDSHKCYERVEQRFSFDILPQLLKYSIAELLKK